MKLRTILGLAAAAALVLAGCKGLTGHGTDPVDISKLPTSGTWKVGDTTYVEIISPFSCSMQEPSAMIIGNDQMLYIADTKNDRIVMMDLTGTVLGTKTVHRPIAISQDFRLDLLVSGVVLTQRGDSAGAIFRIHMVDASHDITAARMDTVWRELARPKRRFPGVLAFPDNSFIVARAGDVNDASANSSFVDPDGRIIQFDAADNFITPLGDFVTRSGAGITDINFPTSLGGFSNSFNFILLQRTEGMAYGALWMAFNTKGEGGWQPVYDPANPDQRNVDFIKPNRFSLPAGVVIDNKRRDIFIADAALDSVFKFDSRGRFKSASFGLNKSEGRMRKPVALAFFDKTLYVLDAANSYILRYKLNTDF